MLIKFSPMKLLKIIIPFIFMSLVVMNAFPQGWTMQKPFPTFNHLRAVDFPSDLTGYLGGDNGTLLKTIDGGITWNQLNSPEYLSGGNLNFLSNDTGFVAQNSAIHRTRDGGETWDVARLALWSTANETFFVNDTLGFAYGYYSLLYKTTDGGDTWQKISFNTFNDNVYECARFTDENNGYIINHEFPYHEYILMRTRDGGQTWDHMELPAGVSDVASVTVLGPGNIWIASAKPFPNGNYWTGKEARVYHTTDDGITWTTHPIGMCNSSYPVENIHFFNETEGRVIGFAHLWTTSDGGQTWVDHENYDIDYSNGESGISWLNYNNVFIANYQPSLIRTSDNGSTFEQLTQETDYQYNCVYFSDSSVGVAAGYMNDYDGVMIRQTGDGGKTWTDAEIDTSFYDGSVNDIDFSDRQNGIATLNTGILRTHNGGQTWNYDSTGYALYNPQVEISENGEIYIMGSSGVLIKSFDNGDSWQLISEGIENQLLVEFQYTGNNTLFMLCSSTGYPGRLYKSEDDGVSWNIVSLDSYYCTRAMYFYDHQHGMLSMDNKDLLYTNDGGNSWSQSSTSFPFYATYIKMFDALNGVVVCGDRYLAETSDGGQTFEIVYQNEYPDWNEKSGSYFLSKDHGWTVGHRGMIQRYDSYITDVEQLPTSQDITSFLLPNPTTGKVMITGASGKLTITSITGATCFTARVKDNEQLNLSNLPAGIYIATITDERRAMSMKFVKF